MNDASSSRHTIASLSWIWLPLAGMQPAAAHACSSSSSVQTIGGSPVVSLIPVDADVSPPPLTFPVSPLEPDPLTDSLPDPPPFDRLSDIPPSSPVVPLIEFDMLPSLPSVADIDPEPS